MSAVTRSDPFAAWVTPQQQLEQIIDQIPDKEIEETELAKRISPYASQLLPPIRNIIVRYAGPDYLDPRYTLWHKALTNLNALPTKMPLLAAKTFQALEEENSPLQKFVLLIPSEFDDEEVFKKVTQAYEDSLSRKEPFNGHFLNQTNQWVWVVVTGLLPKSDRSFKTCKAKEAMITNLNKSSKVVYEIPPRETARTAAFLYFVSTGQSLYKNYPIIVKGNRTIERHGVLFSHFNYDSATALVFFDKCSNFICRWSHGIGVMCKL